MPQRFVGGVVAGWGQIFTGEGGFTVDHTSLGHYSILFEPRFNRITACVVTQAPGFDGDTRDNATAISITNESCRIKTGDADGNASDRNFSFIAIGDKAVFLVTAI